MIELRPIDSSSAFGRQLRVADLFRLPGMSTARVVAGHDGLDRRVATINVMQVPTDRYAKRDGLLLAAASAFAEIDNAAELLERLVGRHAAALAVRGAPLPRTLGDDAIQVAERRGLPLIELPAATHLDELMSELLETLVADQYRDLRAAGAVRDRLTEYVLSGGGLDGLPDAMAEIVNGDVVAYDACGRRLSASFDANVEAADGVASAWAVSPSRDPVEAAGGWVLWPVDAGSERLGALVARPPGREPVVFAALEHGATNAALQMLHEREARATDAHLRAGFFRDLLQGSLDAQAADRRARAIGWVPGTYRVLLIESADAGAVDVAGLTAEPLVVEYAGATLAVLAEPGGGLARVRSSLRDRHMGVSAPREGVGALPQAVAEAREALDAARRFDGSRRVRHFEDLGSLRMLARVPVGELIAFHHEVLGPLDALSEELREPLLATLELLLATGLNLAETGRRGGWHYNTVRYRVARLMDLFGPFAEDGATVEALSLALLLRAELGAAAA